MKYLLEILITGLTDYCNEGQFKWVSDGSNVTYHNWNENEPNNYEENEDCVHISETTNQWNDRRCLTKLTSSGNIMTALCQKSFSIAYLIRTKKLN